MKQQLLELFGSQNDLSIKVIFVRLLVASIIGGNVV